MYSQPLARSQFIAWSIDVLQPSAICTRTAQARASANPPPLFFPLLTVSQLSPMMTVHVRALFNAAGGQPSSFVSERGLVPGCSAHDTHARTTKSPRRSAHRRELLANPGYPRISPFLLW